MFLFHLTGTEPEKVVKIFPKKLSFLFLKNNGWIVDEVQMILTIHRRRRVVQISALKSNQLLGETEKSVAVVVFCLPAVLEMNYRIYRS
jgi:hypothetical protein